MAGNANQTAEAAAKGVVNRSLMGEKPIERSRAKAAVSASGSNHKAGVPEISIKV